MRTQFLTQFIFSFCIIVLLSSCNTKRAIEEKINETIAEKIIGISLGINIETSNISDAKNASAKIDMIIDGKKIDFVNSKSVFNITSGSNDEVIIAISLKKYYL